MSKFYKTKEFKSLEKEWYRKLAKEGFDDAEDTSKDYRPLVAWHSFRFSKTTVTQRDALDLYYHRAKELLSTYEFKCNIHRLIWELHSEGYSKRKIEKAISGHKDSLKREWIGHIIRLIAKEIK